MVLAVMFTTNGMLSFPGLWICAFPVSPAALSEQERGKPEAPRGAAEPFIFNQLINSRLQPSLGPTGPQK